MSSSDLIAYFYAQAQWRKAKAEEYPEDKRNAQSARALESLAEYVESGEAEARDPSILESIEQHISDSGAAPGGQEAQRLVSRYGFGYEATNPAQHEELLADLWIGCMEDAYEFAREHGEDWTDTLFPFEVEAATDGVHLPRRYWELRPKQFEHELEEAVQSYRGEGE